MHSFNPRSQGQTQVSLNLKPAWCHLSFDQNQMKPFQLSSDSDRDDVDPGTGGGELCDPPLCAPLLCGQPKRNGHRLAGLRGKTTEGP